MNLVAENPVQLMFKIARNSLVMPVSSQQPIILSATSDPYICATVFCTSKVILSQIFPAETTFHDDASYCYGHYVRKTDINARNAVRTLQKNFSHVSAMLA